MQEYVLRKRPVITIALITAICLLGNEMLFIVLPIYWKFFGLDSLWQVGVLLSINRFVRIPINSVVGWCYQKISKRTGVLFSIILATISTYSYGMLKGFWLLLLVRILWGIAWSFLRLGGYLTVISCSDGKTRGQLIGLYNGLWGLGALFGMLIGGLLSDLIGIPSITTGFAVLAILTIPLAIIFIPNLPNEEQSKEKQIGSILGSTQHRKVLFNGLFVAFVVYGVFFASISKLIEFHMEGNVSLLGMTLGAAGIAGIVQSIKMGIDPFLAPTIGKWSDLKFGRILPLTFAFLGGTLFMATIPLSGNLLLLFAMILVFQIICTFLITMSDSLAVDLANGPLAIKTMTFYTLFADLGAAIGPLLSFIVLDFVGFPWLYWFTSFLLFVAFLFWLKEHHRQKVRSISIQGKGF